MVALASGFARSPRSLAGVRSRERRLRRAARSRLRSIVRRRFRACTPNPAIPGAALRLRRTAARRLRRLSLPSPCPAVWTSAASHAFASRDADAVGFVPDVGEEVSGRVASRPGCPAEPAERSQPFGRASLASPLASLTARSAYPAVRCAHRPLRSHHRRELHRRSGRSAAVASSPWRYAPGALRRRGPTAHAPRRLPSGSGSGTVFPNVRYPGSGLLYTLRWLGSHTPRSGLPRASKPTFHNAPHPVRPAFCCTPVRQNHAGDVPETLQSI